MKTPKMIDFKKMERKWQRKWEKEKVFEVSEKSKKPEYYVLEMYPYPSGSGLHIGHAFNYTIGDVYARFKRMNGFNVLYPMGYDSFGLPAENAAIKNKSHPKKFTEDAIKNYIKQQKGLGLSYDWSRMVECHKPDFYKWDQWIFLQMLKKGLAYKKKAPVNWCPKCNTVLANEQVIDGKCMHHENCEIQVKHLEQWFFKTTAYADELYDGLDFLKDWPEDIKRMQRNWIGKSYGVEIDFEVNGEKWPIYTTRPDTIFGVTFMVVSSQHPKLMDLVEDKQKGEVEKFLKKVKTTSRKRIGDLEKEGAFTGSYAVNPANGEKIPIYTGNFVVADYGCGMVMAVPAHDQRDFDFAKKYNIPIRVVIKPFEYDLDEMKMARAYTGEGELINSEEFNFENSKESVDKIIEFLGKKGVGKRTINYKLRDWLISRQRFWGTPIPIIYCDKCGAVPVPEKDLPVKLPEDIKFESKKNPLVGYDKFVKAKCPKCKGEGKRETDTMDTFVNSSWYFLRYCDANNSQEIFDKKKVKYWMPIDTYVGGREHATGHLIYFRFYTKLLRDIGILDFDEPVKRLFNQGMVHGENGEKMSKSKGNVVLPEEVSKKFGIDSARLFLVSLGGLDKNRDWSDNGAEGSLRFIKRVMDYASDVKFGKSSAKVEHKINKMIKEVSEDIESMKYNLAVIKIRRAFDSFEKEIARNDFDNFLKILSVFCPHVCEELWSKIRGKGFISLASWPEIDSKKINDSFDRAEQTVDKTVGDILNILKIVDGEKIYVYVLPNELEFYSGDVLSSRVGKEVRVFAVNDPKKYDPKNKSSKVKPGRPGIYIE